MFRIYIYCIYPLHVFFSCNFYIEFNIKKSYAAPYLTGPKQERSVSPAIFLKLKTLQHSDRRQVQKPGGIAG